MWSILLHLSWNHLRLRPFRVLLTIAGIAIGVSAWLAIRTANTEVYRSFERSVDTVVGRATVIISGGSEGIDERVIETIRGHPGVQSAHPLLRIDGKVQRGLQAGRRIPIYGLDVLDHLGTLFTPSSSGSSELPNGKWEQIFSSGIVFLGPDVARELGLAAGSRFEVEVDGKPVELSVGGLLNPAEGMGRRWASYGVMDIAAAQWTFERLGLIHEIHVIPDPGISREGLLQALQEMVPPSLRVRPSAGRNNQVEGMLKAFQMNLSMLSGIGLLVGLFLVYNTMAFSVAQHRKEIGILRSLGCPQETIIRLFLLEAGLLGLIGGMGGCWFGVGLADLLMGLVGQSVGELYGLQSALAGSLSIPRILEGIGMGIAVSLAGALRPSFEAGRMAPVQALSLSPDFQVSRNQGSWALPVLVSTLVGSLVLSVLPAVDGIPWGGYASALCLLVGGTVVGPLLFRLMSRSNGVRGNTKNLGLWPSLAAEQMTRHIGRTSVTLSAIVVGLSILVGVGLMIQSFRQTVELWIEQTMVADLIVAPASWLTDGEPQPGLPRSLRRVLQDVPGVADVDAYREVSTKIGDQPIALVSRDLSLHANRSRYLFQHGDSTDILKRTTASHGVLVSEVLAHRLHLEEHQTVEVDTPSGRTGFRVEGIFFDYATDGGKLVMDEGLYRQYWSDPQATVFALYLDEGSSLDRVRNAVHEALSGQAAVTTISNRELRREILDIFDRTFRVTYVLELIALSVAALGIVNTLMTAIMERRRELATLRALGASTGQVKRLIYWEAGFLGMWGAGIGIAVGVVLSLLLIKVINKQSFGWTIQWNVSPEPLVMGLLVAAAAVLAGAWWPARWAVRQGIANGLRYE